VGDGAGAGDVPGGVACPGGALAEPGTVGSSDTEADGVAAGSADVSPPDGNGDGDGTPAEPGCSAVESEAEGTAAGDVGCGAKEVRGG
jgi:hypothetical protein